MMTLAFVEGQRREALLWLAGLLVFGGELLLHWSIVSNLIVGNDQLQAGEWIVFGGWPFVLHTAQMNPFLIALPPWAVAIVLPLALLGLARWRGAREIRIAITVGIYVLAFSIVGRSNNIAWGLMYAFVMPLGLLHAPGDIRELWQPIHQKLKENVARNKKSCLRTVPHNGHSLLRCRKALTSMSYLKFFFRAATFRRTDTREFCWK